jgi:hypothetical protein
MTRAAAESCDWSSVSGKRISAAPSRSARSRAAPASASPILAAQPRQRGVRLGVVQPDQHLSRLNRIAVMRQDLADDAARQVLDPFAERFRLDLAGSDGGAFERRKDRPEAAGDHENTAATPLATSPRRARAAGPGSTWPRFRRGCRRPRPSRRAARGACPRGAGCSADGR